MLREDINIEALKNNKEFLANLVLLEEEMAEQKSLVKGYQLLDALLLTSEDEDKINDIFTFILREAFDRLAESLSQHKRFDMGVAEELFTARAIYEHAIERYSENDKKGAKELFEVLYFMVESEPRLRDAMMVHAISVISGVSFEEFIESTADTTQYDEDDTLAYFLMSFRVDTEVFFEANRTHFDTVKAELKVLENSK